jgi:mono/diheme cytochrome c family protein
VPATAYAFLILLAAAPDAPAAGAVDFARDIAPILAERCLACHGPQKQSSGYRLDVKSIALARGELSAPNIVPGDSAASPLVRYISGADPEIEMPPRGEKLTAAEVALVRRWIDEGASWPEDASAAVADPGDWWSLRPIERPEVPGGAANPIDAFVSATLSARGLAMAPEADARTLCRRVSFDLTGLPPTAEEVASFVADEDPSKYERLVDRLLASPRYGERWARHWLDVVHYADTHGYDKDKPREHAWPYRDYVIRALNEDRPYARFVEEQIAGDALYPGTRDGIEALGFIAAGPWDLIGHEEVSEEKIDGMFARHFDRDDMVGNAIGTFASVTVQCAQCHDHKFDPVPQRDYYALQAVFAAIDRAEKRYDPSPEVAAERVALDGRRTALVAERTALDAAFREAGGAELARLDDAIARAERSGAAPEFGYHSELSLDPTATKWVQVDLGSARAFDAVALYPCRDDYNGIGDGFGFPAEFRVEASDDAEFARDVVVLARGSDAMLGTPRTAPVVIDTPGAMARHVRVTATRLALRSGDFNFALAELEVLDAARRNLAEGRPVASLDSIEMGERWRRTNLTDGVAPARVASPSALDALRAQRESLRRTTEATETAARRDAIGRELAEAEAAIAALPPQQTVYAGTVHEGSGAFRGTGAAGGRPREIRVLARGQVTQPGEIVQPAALSVLDPLLPSRFDLAPDAPESARRAALARWLTDARNPLVWRSIVNRVWHHHFGRGIVDTPNDFGRMGGAPSHPELLDWLAANFRDEMGGSLKSLHRLIVTSAAYRQRSDRSDPAAEAVDRDNRLLWRANARKLEAEAVRDAVLAASGSLDLAMGGPGYRDFAIEQPEHSPHYRYDLADPDDPSTFRRSVYRFIVRSQMQPFMTALDCADPSQRVDRRNQSLSPNQALAFLNNGFMLVQAERLAERVRREAGDDPEAQAAQALRRALGRDATLDERARLAAFVREHGLANACRVLFNLNEFAFVD